MMTALPPSRPLTDKLPHERNPGVLDQVAKAMRDETR